MNIENSFTWKSVVSFIAFNLTFWITNWILFKKANQPGWAAITPVYGYLVYAKIAKTNKYAAAFAGTLSMIGLLTYFSSQAPFNGAEVSGDNVLGVSLVVAGAAELVISVYMFLKFYKKYEINGFFWLAYIFLPVISLFFANKAKYIDAEKQINTKSKQPKKTA